MRKEVFKDLMNESQQRPQPPLENGRKDSCCRTRKREKYKEHGKGAHEPMGQRKGCAKMDGGYDA